MFSFQWSQVICVPVSEFSPHLFNRVKIQVRSKQLKRLVAASNVSPTPSLISFHLASLSSPHLQTSLTPTGIPYQYSFTYFPHSLFYLIHSTLSPLLPTTLSANNLKFVCHRSDTEGNCPSYYLPPLLHQCCLAYNTSHQD